MIVGFISCDTQTKNSSAIIRYNCSDDSILLHAVFNPKSYVVYRANSPIVIDGVDNENDWTLTPDVGSFWECHNGESSGGEIQNPVKLLWDTDYLYVFSKMYEPHVWVDRLKNDGLELNDLFQLFIDFNNDGVNVLSIAINPINNINSNLYSNRGSEQSDFNKVFIDGIISKVLVRGTINDPSDIDEYWCVEMKIPISKINEKSKGKSTLAPDIWRINFCRTKNFITSVEGIYKRTIDSKSGMISTGTKLVWAPINVENLLIPELYGFVKFSNNKAGRNIESFDIDISERLKWELRTIYYAQKVYFFNSNKYASSLRKLQKDGLLIKKMDYEYQFNVDDNKYEVIGHIDNEKESWKINDLGIVSQN